MKWAGLLRLAELLLELYRRMQQAARRARRQRERDDLEQNPAGWFGRRFGGRVRNRTDTPTDSDRSDPGE